MRHDIMIQNVLPQRLLQVGNQRGANKAFDFYCYLALPLGSGQQVLGTQVNVQIPRTPLQTEWIVRNGPAVFGESVLDGVMVEVFCGHGQFLAGPARSVCASAASAWGSQKVMSMARYSPMAVDRAARASSPRPI
jgi:hypothetical protein